MLAEGLDLKAQLGEERAVYVDQLAILLRQAQRHAREQLLGHDAALLLLEPVENHPLVGGVLVDQNQLLTHLDKDVQLQCLTHYLVVGYGQLFNILNRVFHNRGCRIGAKSRVFSRLRSGNGDRGRGMSDGRHVHACLIGDFRCANRDGRRGLRCRGGLYTVALGAEALARHAAVEVGPGRGLVGRPRGHGSRRGGGLGGRGFLGLDAVLLCQGRQHRVIHQVEHALFLGEFDLGLGGVDVDVHRGVGERQIDHAGGEAPHQQCVFIRLLHSGLQQGRADIAPIAVEKLRGAVAAARRGGGGKAGSAHVAVLAGNRQQILGHLAAQQSVDAGRRFPVAGGEKFFLPVAHEAHRNLGPAQRAAQRGLHAGRGLRPIGFEKLEPGGGVEEDAAHGHDRTLGAAGLVHILNIARGDGDVGAAAVALPTGGQLDFADGGDGGQRLTAKAHRADGLQSLLVMELGGGVAHEGDARVLGGHAAAVVGHADIGGPAAAQLHGHRVGPGVKGVFHQLLDHRRGAFDHLAGGDHIGHMGGEYVDDGHEQILQRETDFIKKLLYMISVETSIAFMIKYPVKIRSAAGAERKKPWHM